MAGPARKSLLSHERSELEFSTSQKKIQERRLECHILDICGAHNNRTKYIPDVEITSGIEFIVFCKNNLNVYRHLLRNIDYEVLRTCYGEDSNLRGREIIIFANSFSPRDVYEGRCIFGTEIDVKYQDEFEQGYISLAGFGGIDTDFSYQKEVHKTNPTSGSGNVWRPI